MHKHKLSARALHAQKQALLTSAALSIRSAAEAPIALSLSGRGLIATSDIDYVFSGLIACVRKNFRFDGASVPRLLWLWLGFNPLDSKIQYAACLHDWCYRTQKWDRVIADAMFHSAMVHLGVARWRARLMYWGVRAFGRGAWEANRKLLAAAARAAYEDRGET